MKGKISFLMAMDRDDILRIILKERVKLLAYLAMFIQDRHVAEDLFQDLSIQACQKADTINDTEHLMGWLRTGAKMLALNELRRQRNRKVVYSDNLVAKFDQAWSEMEDEHAADTVDALRKCIDSLPEHSRSLLHLRYQQEMGGNAIAKHLNRSRNAVYIALSRIHKSLSQCIKNRLSTIGGVS